ncbi:MAG: hypothetical protein NUW01_18950 [Gemmatimonadaceae bacterium]|nr:hypothetical protein [Gemmatimonadaceae bacterium]
MRVLLDENLPLEFAAEIHGHKVSTVRGRGWAGLQNGALMKEAAAVCDVFVTMDKNKRRCSGLFTSFTVTCNSMCDTSVVLLVDEVDCPDSSRNGSADKGTGHLTSTGNRGDGDAVFYELDVQHVRVRVRYGGRAVLLTIRPSIR